jgi:hypothetical protein
MRNFQILGMTGMKALFSRIYKRLVRLSIGFNRLLGGESQQTFSARNWQRKRNGLTNLVFLIDFFLGKGHCCECWVNWKIRRYHDD